MARAIAPQCQAWRLPLDGFDAQQALERLQVGQPHFQGIERQQFMLLDITEPHAAHPQHTSELHHRCRALLERQAQVRIDHARIQAHRQTGGQIAPVRGKIEIFQLDARIGAQTLGKGRGLGMGFECAAVEFERQPGHHLDLTLGP